MLAKIRIGKYTLPQVWKSVVASLSAAVAQEATILTLVNTSHVVPATWIHGLVVGFSGVAGFLTWAKSNELA